MTSSWTIPEKTLELQPGMLDPWVMELIANDAADCVQIETPVGCLIRVLPAADQLFTQPPRDLEQMLLHARTEKCDWLLIRGTEKFKYH